MHEYCREALNAFKFSINRSRRYWHFMKYAVAKKKRMKVHLHLYSHVLADAENMFGKTPIENILHVHDGKKKSIYISFCGIFCWICQWTSSKRESLFFNLLFCNFFFPLYMHTSLIFIWLDVSILSLWLFWFFRLYWTVEIMLIKIAANEGEQIKNLVDHLWLLMRPWVAIGSPRNV